MNTDLLTALPGLMVIGAGVGLVALFRDRADADQHDLSDYHEPTAEPPASQRRYRDSDRKPDDILPPAPAGMNAGCPLYAEALFASWRKETPAQTAARFLRELSHEATAQHRELVSTR